MKHEEALETMAAERYILGELSDTERDLFEEHFFECVDCASDVRILSQLKEGTRAAARAELPKREKKESWLDRWTLSWFRPGFAFATIGILAAVASLTSWQYLQLRRATAPQTVASIMLRPEARGASSEVNVSPIGAFLLLEADLPGASGDLTWQINRDGDSRPVAQGSGQAPEPGSSYKILTPKNTVPAGAYRVTVRAANGVRTWTFRFQAAGT